MSVLTIGILGIAGALLAVELKGLKGEYGIYLVAAVGLVIFFYGITKLKTVIETIRQVQSYIRLNRTAGLDMVYKNEEKDWGPYEVAELYYEK